MSMVEVYSSFGQLYYTDFFEDELFFVLSDMFGPTIHIEFVNSEKLRGRIYYESGFEEISFKLRPKENNKIREKLIGIWTKDIPKEFKETLNGDLKKDTLIFEKNKYYATELGKPTEGLWDVFHNGKFLGFRMKDPKDNEYYRPEKFRFEFLEENTLYLKLPEEDQNPKNHNWKIRPKEDFIYQKEKTLLPRF